MKAYSVIMFLVCLNMAAFIIQQSGAIVGSKELYISPFDISSQFSLTYFAVLASAVTGIGIIAFIFRPSVYSIGALLIFVFLGLLPITQWLVLGVPIMLTAVLPSEIVYVSYVVSAFFAVTFFIFLMEIISQRQVT